jgi:hypothetical protein
VFVVALAGDFTKSRSVGSVTMESHHQNEGGQSEGQSRRHFRSPIRSRATSIKPRRGGLCIVMFNPANEGGKLNVAGLEHELH